MFNCQAVSSLHGSNDRQDIPIRHFLRRRQGATKTVNPPPPSPAKRKCNRRI